MVNVSQSIRCAFVLLIASSIHFMPVNGIMNGDDASPGFLPYVVSIAYNGNYACGGAILKEDIIVTVARCVMDEAMQETLPLEGFQVMAGTTLRDVGFVRLLEKIIIHDDPKNNDLAILKLDVPYIFNQLINSLGLPPNPMRDGQMIIISGWGETKVDGAFATFLQYGYVYVWNQEECESEMGFKNPGILCLYHLEDMGACDGDLGAPAIYGYLLGAALKTPKKCGEKGFDLYVNFYYYKDWILENMN